ncbi:keratin, type I cytoskeletal 18-like [Ambystoma mexicanum]|uniref:keratin, type I cytoskeletal 18-like n=1 Tax=Ambystoma mexicanum TaxID=8296 RepID=UPI0037E7360D
MAATLSVRSQSFGKRPTFSSYSVGGRSIPKSRTSVSSIKFTASSPVKNGFSSAGVINGAVKVNDKETMRCLNDRLASYLEKVRYLEKTNQELEIKIQDKMKADAPVFRDHGPVFAQAHALSQEIAIASQENARLMLSIDNAKLAAGDFRMKWETEAAILQSVERDIAALRGVKDEHVGLLGSLRAQMESLEDELHFLKQNHKEEMDAMKESVANSKVDVEVDAVRGPDLASILADVRSQYEEIVKKNKEEADALFQTKVDSLMMQVEQDTKASENAKEELTQRRRLLQSLEIELESLKNQTNALRGNLEEASLTYRNDMDGLQESISRMEAELAEIQRNMQSEKFEYEALLRIKETLETEIAVYRRLLGGEEEEPSKIPPPKEPEPTTKKIVKVVTQTLVDGKVIEESSEVEEFEVKKK